MHAELQAWGKSVSRKRVARLMRKRGLEARPKRRFRRTTDSDHAQPIAPNLLDRKFMAVAPNQKWVTDITYIRTCQGWLYLATVLDLFSRRIVGWAITEDLRTGLVLDALKMAPGHRLPEAGLVHHSDRGSQYASEDYAEVFRNAGIACSMSRKGNCWDNAVAESFFSTLKLELVYRQPWPTRGKAKAAVIEWIEVFYNTKRRHSHLGGRTPAEHEKLFHTNPEELLLAA